MVGDKAQEVKKMEQPTLGYANHREGDYGQTGKEGHVCNCTIRIQFRSRDFQENNKLNGEEKTVEGSRLVGDSQGSCWLPGLCSLGHLRRSGRVGVRRYCKGILSLCLPVMVLLLYAHE